MVHFKLRRAENGFITGFCCSGHAEYADKGNDVVCAAVSMLVINTINSIDRLLPEDAANMEVFSDEEKGEISCDFKSPPSEKAALLLESLYYGISDSEKNYGCEFLKLTEERQ